MAEGSARRRAPRSIVIREAIFRLATAAASGLPAGMPTVEALGPRSRDCRTLVTISFTSPRLIAANAGAAGARVASYP